MQPAEQSGSGGNGANDGLMANEFGAPSAKTTTTPAAGDGPTELGDLPKDVALTEPGAAEPADAEPAGEPTQVVHVRAFPREWEVVDPGHNATVLVQIGQWKADFRLEAIGEDGCFLRVVLPKNLLPLPLDENCRLSMKLADGTLFYIQGKAQSAGISSGGEATMKILFRNVIAEDASALSSYREQLKEIPGPAADADSDMPSDEALEVLPQELGTNTRKRILRALGGAAAAVFLFTTVGGAIYLARSPEGSDIPLVPIVREPTLEKVSCSVLFDERGYRPKCPGTSKPRLTWASNQQKGAPVLHASISYDRDGKRCETAPDAVTAIRGRTMPAVMHMFTCK